MPKDAAQPTLAVSIGQYSDAGRKASNQDFHGALVPEGAALALKGVTLALADGISSSAVGGEAAELTVASLLGDYYCTSDAWTARTAATSVIAATNGWLHARNRRAGVADADLGHVCTLAALILKGREAHVLHVGDSRVWRVAGETLEPLTEDHRVLLPSGGGWLSRAMGAEARVEVDYRRLPVAPGDVFLLTTDGVHEHWVPADVVREIRAAEDLGPVARFVCAAALAAGSDDNLTVQIVRIDTLPAPDAGALLGEAASLRVPPLPRAGDHLDGFRIVREIHATDRSHVFLATAPDGTRVALKIPSTEHREDQDYLRRFMLEEWIARRLSSPHVLRAAPEAGRTALYAVTEFVEGRTLRQWMTDTPAPEPDAVRDIVEQISRGLRAFHRREMIHQDLRPENVMIDPDGTVKIIDLGSARVAGVEETLPGTLGEMPGTYQYTAPEYLSGDTVSWRSDQYALGVIAYEMLTGRLPYGTQVARIRSVGDQRRLNYRPARDDDSGVPAWMDAALRRACHPDPLRRYDALSEFVADLRRPGSAARAESHVPLAARNPVRFWQAVSAGLAVLCLILAVTHG
ncbi:bifunctional protein-serine/threonine kinase/phosphatase [Salipiger sp.]|uniref:bifunctional protein-serine/threonine kinase/phosphatase n=1 Tax=Salipiger sp. TaxID=2078585 RepID=UPI003A987C8B